MKPAWRASVLFVVILATAMIGAPRALLAQDAAISATSAKSALTLAQMEEFLLNARILKSREIGKGVTVLMDELERLEREKKKTIPSGWRSASR
jgi:hypothetical protein